MYNYILIVKETGKYLGWIKAETEPPCGKPDKLEWIEWGKELPDDIDEKEYFLKDGELCNA